MFDSETTEVNEMWETPRDTHTLQNSTKSRSPHCQSRSKDNCLWTGPELKKMIGGSTDISKQRRKLATPSTLKLLDLKQQVQKGQRQALTGSIWRDGHPKRSGPSCSKCR